MVGLVNAGEGFRISGWFKPASDEEGTAAEHKNFHVACLYPEAALTDEQLAKKYKDDTATTQTAATPRRPEQTTSG